LQNELNYTYISVKFIRKVKNRIYIFPMNVPKDEVYLKEQHSESFTIWSTSNTVNTEGKSVSCRYIISEPTI